MPLGPFQTSLRYFLETRFWLGEPQNIVQPARASVFQLQNSAIGTPRPHLRLRLQIAGKENALCQRQPSSQPCYHTYEQVISQENPGAPFSHQHHNPIDTNKVERDGNEVVPEMAAGHSPAPTSGHSHHSPG